MALNINGRMKVKTLKADFKEEFGLTLRVYDGRSFADNDATLASIRKGDSKGGEFSPKRNTKVGNLEDKILELFGIKTQVAGSDDSYLCNNDFTLAAALEYDEKKMGKKVKKVGENTIRDEEIIDTESIEDLLDICEDSTTDDETRKTRLSKAEIIANDSNDIDSLRRIGACYIEMVNDSNKATQIAENMINTYINKFSNDDSPDAEDARYNVIDYLEFDLEDMDLLEEFQEKLS